MLDGFTLDPRIADSTVQIADWPLCRVLLKDDARFPWLILVPRRADVVEITDLDEADHAALWDEIRRACRLLQREARPEKLNVASLGNVVPQLHVHVIARFGNDPAWPDTVWCHGAGPGYAEDERDRLVALYGAAAAQP